MNFWRYEKSAINDIFESLKQDKLKSENTSSESSNEKSEVEKNIPDSQKEIQSSSNSETENIEDTIENETEKESNEELGSNSETENIEDISQLNKENANENLDKRKQKLKQLSEKLREYREKKKAIEEKIKKEKIHLHGEKEDVIESEEKKYELSEQTNKFLNQLSELPSFENRQTGSGYSIDTNTYTEIPDSMVRTLITKFLNQRFCKHNTDLNIRSNSLEKSRGFYKWEVKDVVVHLKTHQITKVFNDKFGYEYASGKNENVPLSFYFDLSGSMSEYTNMLSVIAIELLKKNVKVLIGFNERVNVQIDSISKSIEVAELVEILEKAGYYSNPYQNRAMNLTNNPNVKYKYINKNLDNYLITKKAEKCVIFSDFDPLDQVINLSQKTEVYWFCFESMFYDFSYLKKYNGFVYKVRNASDIVNGLIKVNQKRFENLCYFDNPKNLQKKLERR